jgi:hypothetical protein
MNKISSDQRVICCFCGIGLPLEIAIVLNIKPNIKSTESQQLFSHKEHFIHLVKNNVPLHPDFF